MICSPDKCNIEDFSLDNAMKNLLRWQNSNLIMINEEQRAIIVIKLFCLTFFALRPSFFSDNIFIQEFDSYCYVHVMLCRSRIFLECIFHQPELCSWPIFQSIVASPLFPKKVLNFNSPTTSTNASTTPIQQKNIQYGRVAHSSAFNHSSTILAVV